MAMREFLGVGVLLGTALLAVGCGDDGKPKQKCPEGVVANQTVPGCACDGDAGGTGVQTCQMDGFLSDCMCGAGAAGTSGGAGTNGTAGTNSTAGTGGGTSGTGGNTDDDAGTPGGGTSGTNGGTAGTGGTTTVPKPASDGTLLSTCDPLAQTPCEGDLVCYSGAGATSVGFCTPTCTTDDDCTAAGAQLADFTCSTSTGGLPGGGGGTQSCRQSCTGVDDKSCPEFMSCTAVQGGYRCLYDEKDIGTGDKKQYEKCESAGDCVGDLICYGGGLIAGGGLPGGTSYQGFCTEACTEDADCKTAPSTGDAAYTCGTTAGECRLDCSPDTLVGADKTCPDGMVCATIGGGPISAQRCVYETTTSGGI